MCPQRDILFFVLLFLNFLLFNDVASYNFEIKNHQALDDIVAKLQSLQGAQIKRVDIELTISQPSNHDDSSSREFEQRVILTHKDFNKPVVLWIEGYAINNKDLQEITQILDANQIIVEHRYFGESIPDTFDWRFLNIRQAAADHHRIAQLFETIYPGKWISAGISKGGQAAMYHRRFYPEDVDATICYVAPLNFSARESRIDTFLSTVGSEDCRAKIVAFQKQLLQEKETLLSLYQKFTKKKGYTFGIGLEKAYEYGVLEYAFAFWQWHHIECSEIPAKDKSNDEILNHFVEVSSPYYFSDQGIAYYKPFFYQALTEMGYYTYDVNPLRNYMKVVMNPDFTFAAPSDAVLHFNPETMRDISEWMMTQARTMLFIYGELDPWTASAVNLNGNDKLKRFILKGGDHLTRIKHFPETERDKIYQILEQWLELKTSK
jgi:hypothetical protein